MSKTEKDVAKASHATKGYGPLVSRGFQSHGLPWKKSSILMGFSRINHPAIGVPPFMETPMYIYIYTYWYSVCTKAATLVFPKSIHLRRLEFHGHSLQRLVELCQPKLPQPIRKSSIIWDWIPSHQHSPTIDRDVLRCVAIVHWWIGTRWYPQVMFVGL